jgi:deoxyribodipyrimidine photo-lyase
MVTLVWYRNDLRVFDHPALDAAVEDPGPVVPVFLQEPEHEEPWAMGEAAQWWLHHALADLGRALVDRGSRLVLRSGDAVDELVQLSRAVDADRVRFTERVQPHLSQRADEVVAELEDEGLDVVEHDGRLLHDPEAIETTSGGPYHVFTPFYDKFLDEVHVGPSLVAPERISEPPTWPISDHLDDLDLLPEEDWTEGLAEDWSPGPRHALHELDALGERLENYDESQDTPSLETSRLSPRLAFGELGPRAAWRRAEEARLAAQAPSEEVQAYQRQLVWREFSYHLIHHYPETATEPLRDKFEAFAWREDDEALERWQKGQTGYPIVDAGMRQLWETGWMHNRVRMIVASFLTKDLLVDWRRGAEWFWDTLVDADLANNTMGWQWAAGCGADAQPFFRIFNPVKQGKDHDPDGEYVREWVPELADLPDDVIHEPFEADPMVLDEVGITLGEDYPEPIVDHGEARQWALSAYEAVK